MKSFNFGVWAFDLLEVTKKFNTRSLSYEGADKYVHLATKAVFGSRTKEAVIHNFIENMECYKHELKPITRFIINR